jgi:hypothetical protein
MSEIGEHIPQSAEFEVPQLILESIPQDKLFTVLGLDNNLSSQELLDSVQKGIWYRSLDGKTVIEVRHQDKLKKSQGLLEVSDFDDTLMKATLWHQEEYKRVAGSDALRDRGITISYDKAKQMYEFSKVTPPNVNEPRYTPRINLILASYYAQALEKGQPHEQAWEGMLTIQNEIKTKLMTAEDENFLLEYSLDPDIVDCLLDNHTIDYLNTDFVEDFLEGTEEHDIRAVATRGKIEGPFGQIYKVHTSEIVDRGYGLDIVLYSNDLKAEALAAFYQLVPQALQNGTRVYDDNPSEIDKFIAWGKDHGIRNLEVIRVNHPDAKRKDFVVDTPKIMQTHEQTGTKYDLYFASEDAKRDVVFGSYGMNNSSDEEV